MIIRIGLAAIAAIALALGLTMAIVNFHLSETISSLEEYRFVFIIKELRTAIQTGLDDLELELATMVNMQDRLAQELVRDDRIRTIVIFDDAGQVLFQANAESIPGMDNIVPSPWLQAATDATTAAAWWQSASNTSITVGLNLVNNFGQRVGGLALSYHREVFDNKIAALNQGMLLIAGATLLIAMLIILPIAALVLSGWRSSLQRQSDTLGQFLGQNPGDLVMLHDSANHDLTTEAMIHGLATWQELTDLEQALSAISRQTPR